MNKANELLKNIFGYDKFRPLQEEIIRSVLNKNDTLAVMPTGGGKSVCYQIPALMFSGLTVVVSPLISLMKDQIDQLNELGVPAVMLNSSLDLQDYNDNKDMVLRGKAKLLYVAPETLTKPDIRRLLLSMQVDCIAIDEAHCISEWGHDFRPEYRQLAGIRSGFPSAVCLALTATATERVRGDITANLNFRNGKNFIASFDRENLFFEVSPKEASFGQLMELLKRFHGQSGIVYCFSRNGVDALAARLVEYGYSALPYHAGLSDDIRKNNQDMFIKDEAQIIVATIAFGMGIHKSNIRFVVHYDIPKSIESYYQETGRAGRDGLPAHCLLLYSYSDIHKIKYFIEQKEGNEKAVARKHLNDMIEYAETTKCRRIPLIKYFDKDYEAHDACGMCDNCANEHDAHSAASERADITVEAQKFLSCVKRTNERFGFNHIIDILRGSESQKIIDFGHQNLSTYGIGKEYSKQQWLHLARQFTREGLVLQDADDHGIVKLTQPGYDVMKGELNVAGTLRKEAEKASPAGSANRSIPDYDRELFDILRKKRKEFADAGNVPPYIVFSDRTLAEMAAYYPQHKSSMLDISGVGEHKFEKYGDELIGVIRDYCAEKNISEIPKKNLQAGKTPRKNKFKAVGEAFNNGASIEELASQHEVKQATIINHLYDYLKDGHTLRVDGISVFLKLTDDDKSRIYKAFDSSGTERLKPVFDLLDGSINYETLNAYRLYLLCKDAK